MPALKPATIGQKFLTDCGQNRPLTTVATKLSISSRSFNRLRHCANYVKQFEETQEEFWAREIIWAITKIEKEGSELYYTAVRRLLNVKRKQIAAALPFIADTRIRSIAAEMTED